MTRTWLFGEAEYESSETMNQNFERLFKVSEACGYMIEKINCKNGRVCIKLDGADLEHVEIFFKQGGQVDYIDRMQMTDRNGTLEIYSKESDIVIN